MTEETKKRGRPAKSETIEVLCLQRVGLEDRTTEKGEIVMMPREAARKLQEAGAIKVVI